MSKSQSTSMPPPILPGLSLVPTGKTGVDEKGRRYVIVKLERDKYSDVNYNIKRKPHKSFYA